MEVQMASNDLTKQCHNLLHLGNTQNRKKQIFYWDGNVVSMQKDGEESFYLQDDLGSPMELLNAEGGIRESYAFDEFGVSLVERNGFIQSPYNVINYRDKPCRWYNTSVAETQIRQIPKKT